MQCGLALDYNEVNGKFPNVHKPLARQFYGSTQVDPWVPPQKSQVRYTVDMAEHNPQQEGECLSDGPYEVCNVIGSSWDTGSKKDFWIDNARDREGKRVRWPDKCQIVHRRNGKQCTNDATGGGHMWVKGLWKFWYILPICQGCNMKTDYDDPNYVKTEKTACLVARHHGGSKREGEMKEGDCLYGEFDVSYDPQRGRPPQDLWCDKAHCDNFSKEKCHICDNKATMVGRMWVYRLRTFQFLLPLCDGCKKDDDLSWPKKKSTKRTAILVAVKK